MLSLMTFSYFVNRLTIRTSKALSQNLIIVISFKICSFFLAVLILSGLNQNEPVLTKYYILEIISWLTYPFENNVYSPSFSWKLRLVVITSESLLKSHKTQERRAVDKL